MDKLQYISHTNQRYSLLEGIEAVLEGGCRWIQLRMKDASPDDVLAAGHKAKSLCDGYSATMIVDDYVQLVDAIGADGVHLGKNDMPVSEARRLLSPCKIIGATANTFDDIVAAVRQGADYIGLGPFRFTTTKTKLSPVLGLDGYRRIVDQCRVDGIDIPIVAIGGITLDDVPAIMAAGIDGIAVSSALLNASSTLEETAKFLEAINSKHQ